MRNVLLLKRTFPTSFCRTFFSAANPPGVAAALLALALFLTGSLQAQIFVHTDDDDEDWDEASNWNPAVVPNASGAVVTINRLSGGGNREIDGDGDTYTLGVLNWNNDRDDNERLVDGDFIFESPGMVSTLTYNGTDGGNLQFRDGTNIIVNAGQTLNINNASTDDGSRIVFSSSGSNGELEGDGLVIFNDTSPDAASNLRVIRFQENSNNFEGIFRLNSGTMEIEDDAGGEVFGDGSLEIAGGRVDISDDTIELENDVAINGSFVFAGDEEFEISGTTTVAGSNPTITVENEDEKLIFSGVVDGGGFTVDGVEDAEVIFENGGNTFSGPVAVLGGEVEFDGDGSVGNTRSLTADGGRLSFRGEYEIDPAATIFVGNGADTSLSTPGGSSEIVFNGIIADKPGETGSWAKQGGGRLILGGANTFTGSVAVNNGDLRLNDAAALVTAASVLVDATDDDAVLELNVSGEQNWQLGRGNLILRNGGRLEQQVDGDGDIATIGQTIVLEGTGGEIDVNGDAQMNATGDITGTHLEKSGGGELRFTETPKTYTGTTMVTNGRLRIDDDGIPINTSAIILDDGNLRFGQRRQRTYSLGAGGNAPITIEKGSIEYTDEEGAILTNPVEVAGEGNFRSRIAGSVFEFTGDLTGDGDLTINEGSGGNPVQGGTIFLSGDASAFMGDVDVEQSTLRLGNQTTLGADNFTLKSGATLALDIASPTQLGNVVADDDADFEAGSFIDPNFNGTIAPGANTYTIVTVGDDLTDDGAAVIDRPLADFSLVTAGNELQLTAIADFRGAGLGFNQIQSSVGDYLQTASGGTALGRVRAEAVNQRDVDSVVEFYDSIAADEVGGMMDAAIFHGADQLRSVGRFAPHTQNRLAQENTSNSLFTVESQASAEGLDGWNAFHDVRAQRSSRGREFELGGYEQNGQAFLFGADRQFSDTFGAAFYGGYENLRTEFDRSRGWGSSDTLSVGAVGSVLLPQGYVSLGVQHQHHSFEMERYSSLGTARSNPDGDQLGVILQGATRLGSGPLSIVPTAHIQYNKLWVDGFTETGAPIAQSFEDLETDSLQGGLGLRVGYTIPGDVVTLRPEVFAEYRHEFLDGSREIGSNLIGATGDLRFSTPEREDGYAVVGGALHADFSDNTSAFVEYEAQLLDSDATTYAIYGGMRWAFDGNPLSESVIAFTNGAHSYRETLQGSPIGDAMDAINLRARVDLQYDHGETDARAGVDPDPIDPADTDLWFARRVRLYADRDLGYGFNTDLAFNFGERLDTDDTRTDLFRANVGWDLFEPFQLRFGLDRVPLGYEETTSSATIKTVERSAASRAFGRIGGDQIARDKWSGSMGGRFRELYASNSGPIQRYDFHYEFAIANPREDEDALWEPDANGTTWGESSYYLRIMNELHTSVGQFDFGVDWADIPSFRARSNDSVTGASAVSPFLNYNLGWFNLTSVGYFLDYEREAASGGAAVEAEGFSIIPSLFITPKMELVGMYSNFDTGGDFAIRANQAARNIPTTFPDNRRFDRVNQFYFGLNHYLNGDDFKVMYGVEHNNFDQTRADRSVGEEDSWAFRMRMQLRL